MTVAIFSGGEFYNLTPFDYDILICADKGYEYAKKLNLAPNYIIGDFDSLGFVPNNAEVYDSEKDFSDTELCIKKAIDLGATNIDVYFALGGRIDHELFNISLLKFAKDLGVNARIISSNAIIELISSKDLDKEFEVKPNSTVSLVPFSSAVHIISLEGLKYPFNGEVLKGQTKTLSNVSTSKKISIKIKDGEILLIYFY